MRVRALRSFAGNGFAGYKGTELEVPDDTGADLIRTRYAEKIEEKTEIPESSEAQVDEPMEIVDKPKKNSKKKV
ncbi:hypothetical protein WMO21_02480 [Lachnospiraceae bacterium CLA-AA-H58]|uniref:hypothetical protein n=1 Tax=Pilosibacter fragilis TaxID=3078042 RepID=UPI0032D2DB9A